MLIDWEKGKASVINLYRRRQSERIKGKLVFSLFFIRSCSFLLCHETRTISVLFLWMSSPFQWFLRFPVLHLVSFITLIIRYCFASCHFRMRIIVDEHWSTRERALFSFYLLAEIMFICCWKVSFSSMTEELKVKTIIIKELLLTSLETNKSKQLPWVSCWNSSFYDI